MVSYVDTGEVSEEYNEDWEAEERCEELRTAGFFASWSNRLPEVKEVSDA